MRGRLHEAKLALRVEAAMRAAAPAAPLRRESCRPLQIGSQSMHSRRSVPRSRIQCALAFVIPLENSRKPGG
jgi:hypothetical protein